MKWSILLLHVILALVLVVSCEPPKLQPNIEEYVKQLGHDDWATRDQATKKLIELCNNGYKEKVVDALSKRLTQLDTRDEDRWEVWLRAMQILNHKDVKAEPILVPEKAELAGNAGRLEKKIDTLIDGLEGGEKWEQERAFLSLIELGLYRGSRDKVLDRLRDAAKNKDKPKIQDKARQVFNAVLVRGVNRGLGPALKLTVKAPVSGKIDIVVENGPLGGSCKLIFGTSGSGGRFRGTALKVGNTRAPVDKSFDANGKVELKGIPWPGSARDYYLQAIAAEDNRFESYILSNGVKVSITGTVGLPVEKTVEVEVPVEAPVEAPAEAD